MSKFRTHYENLKVTRDAPIEVIKAAYRVIAQKHHPDTNPSEDAQRIMTIVNEAWRVLSDPKLRAENDAWINEQEQIVQEIGAEKINPSANFYASDGYKASSEYKQRIVQKIGDLKNIVYVRPIFVWVAVLVGMVIVGSLIESVRTEANSIQAEASQQPKVDLSDLVPIDDGNINQKKDNSIAVAEPMNGNDSERKTEKLKFVPLEKGTRQEPVALPHGYISGEPIIANGGLSKFTVDNSRGNLDADIRLYKGSTQVRAFNVKAGRSFTANHLSPGIYRLKFRQFYDGRFHAFEAKDLFNIEEVVEDTFKGRRTSFSDVHVTLYEVTNGNMQVNEIDPSKF